MIGRVKRCFWSSAQHRRGTWSFGANDRLQPDTAGARLLGPWKRAGE